MEEEMQLLAVALALLLNGVEPPQAQVPDPEIPQIIEFVDLRNNRRVRSDTIRYNLQTREGSILNPSTIARDIRQLYALQYFDSIRVEEEQGDNGVIVTFFFEEKPFIRAIDYEGISSITESDILERLRDQNVGLNVEQPYDPAKIRRAETVILDLLAEHGRQNATVEVDEYEIPPTSVGVAFIVDEGAQIKVEEITIEGNEIYSDSDLKGQMELIKEAGPITSFGDKDLYHPLKMNDDLSRIERFYRANGYMRANILDAEIEIRPKMISRTLPFIKPGFPWGIPLPFWKKEVDRFYITIPVEENEQYRLGEVTVTGNTLYADAVILGVLGLIPGEVFNESLLRDGFESLRTFYGNFGYINFTPQPLFDYDDQNRLINVAISIEEDRQFFVNRINFRGNSTTRDKVIRREIMLQEGQVFNSQLWDVSLLRLNQLGYFEEILEDAAQIQPSPTEPEVDILLTVEERGKQSLGFSGGVSGIGGSFLGVDYSTNNFLGFGETLAISLQGGSQVSNFVFSFTEPYLFDRPMSAGFSIFKNDYRYDQARDAFGIDPDVADELGFENRINYEQARRGFNLYTSYPFKVFHRLGITFQYDNSNTSAVNAATSAFFGSIRQSNESSFRSGASLDENFRTRSIIPSYTWSTLNSGYLPTAGQRITANVDFTGGFLGGNVSYLRPTIEYQRFKSLGSFLGKQNVVALRVQAAHLRGFGEASLPFYQRFFMGGDFDLRGFEFRSISPIAWVTRENIDPFTGQPVRFDDIAFVGGDTTAVMNLEYRIPIMGDILTLAPFLDVGNSWVGDKDELVRTIALSDGTIVQEGVKFLAGTNSGIRSSTGVEFQVQMPVINAPFRLIWHYNPNRVNTTFFGPSAGGPILYREKKQGFKFSVGRTF
jgi:outer membrane protein insertion porin family